MNSFSPQLAGFWTNTLPKVIEPPPTTGPKEPSLDLFFSEDRSLTPRVGPAPFYHRDGPALVIGPDKRIKWGPENLIRWSEDLSNPAWGRLAVGIAQVTDARWGKASYILPSTAIDNHLFYQEQLEFLPDMQSVVALQFAVIKLQVSAVNFLLINSPDLGLLFSINLTTGATNIGEGEVEVEVDTDGWMFVRALGVLRGTTGAVRGILNKSDGLTAEEFSGDGTGILATRFQLERNDLATEYHKTEAKQYFGPRWQYDPITGASMGMLCEVETRKNLLTKCLNYNSSAWRIMGGSAFGAGSSDNDILGPDGSMSADRFAELFQGTAQTSIRQSVAVQNGETYTMATYARFHSRQYVSLLFREDAPQDSPSSPLVHEQLFDLSEGTAANYSKNILFVDVVPGVDGWFRLIAVFKATAPGGTFEIRYTDADQSSEIPYQCVGAYNWLWQSQLELGANYSSPIITDYAPVTRAPDVLDFSGAGFATFWNQAEGTMFLANKSIRTQSAMPLMQAHSTSDASSRTYIGSLTVSNKIELVVGNAGKVLYHGVADHGAVRKVALSYKANNYMAAINGDLVSDTLITAGNPPTVDRMDFRNIQIISRIMVFPQAMTEEEILTLTST